MPLSQLTLTPTDREVGLRQQPVRFLDYVINGTPMYPTMQRQGMDLITPLWVGQGDPSFFASSVSRLLGETPGDAPGGRVTMYVCPECGDLGCGAVTVLLSRSDGAVRWQDWGYQNNYEDEIDRSDLDQLPFLEFDAEQYEEALRSALRSS